MNIFVYDHIGRRVTSVPVPSADLTSFGYTDREIGIIRPLVTALIDVLTIEHKEAAEERMKALIWGLGPRMVNEGRVRDIRITVGGADKLLAPVDPLRHSIFVKFMYDHNGRGYEGRFILATKTFDVPNQSAVRKL